MAKFKIGDEVICIENNSAELKNTTYKDGGAGWRKDYCFKITNITGSEKIPIYWAGFNNNGVYEPFLKLEKENNIKKEKKEVSVAINTKIKETFKSEHQEIVSYYSLFAFNSMFTDELKKLADKIDKDIVILELNDDISFTEIQKTINLHKKETNLIMVFPDVGSSNRIKKQSFGCAYSLVPACESTYSFKSMFNIFPTDNTPRMLFDKYSNFIGEIKDGIVLWFVDGFSSESLVNGSRIVISEIIRILKPKIYYQEVARKTYGTFMKNLGRSLSDSYKSQIHNLSLDNISHYKAIKKNNDKEIEVSTLLRSCLKKFAIDKIEKNLSKQMERLEFLCDTNRIVSVVFDGSCFTAKTGEIIIRYKGKDFFIGKSFEIYVNLDGEIRLNNDDGRVDERYDHPHVNEGLPCLGNIKEIIYKHLKEGEFIQILELLYNFLITYNKEGPYTPIELSWGDEGDWCNDCDNPADECECRNRCEECGRYIDDCECQRCPDSGEVMVDESYCDGCSHWDEDDGCQF